MYESGGTEPQASAIYYSDNEEYEKDMKKLSSGIETYVSPQKQGSSSDLYRYSERITGKSAQNILRSISRRLTAKRELEEGWQDHLTADESNFSKFIYDKGLGDILL